MASRSHERLLEILKDLCGKNMNRHKGLEWEHIQVRLVANSKKLRALDEMEKSGGEPDVVGPDRQSGAVIFFDCSLESPTGRRSLCYDDAAFKSRKENKPTGSAMKMASAMGVELLTEQEYRQLQQLGKFDAKTSSWVKTPDAIRQRGGAIFCDCRY